MGVDEVGHGGDRVVDHLAVDLIVAVLGGLHDHPHGALVIKPVVDQPAQLGLRDARALGDHRRRRAGVADESEPGA